MADSPYLPGNILSLAGAAADRLLEAGSGDGALLYLYLLKTGGSYQSAAAARALRGGRPFPAVQAGAGPGTRGCAGGSRGSRAARIHLRRHQPGAGE